MEERAIEFQAKGRRQRTWRGHFDVGFLEGPLAIHAGTQKVLDGADNRRVVLLGMLIILAEGSAIAPFIYTLF